MSRSTPHGCFVYVSNAGPVGAPLADLTEEEMAQLDVLIRKLGAQ